MSRAGSDTLNAQDHDGTGEEDFDEGADDALAQEGEAELSEDGDPEADESEESEEEQSEEDQEEPDLEEEEEALEEAGFKFKDEKSGNFDWKKMNRVLGGDDLEKSFKESQATITRFSQENVQLKKQAEFIPQLQAREKVAGYFDHLFRTNPVIREAVLRDVNGASQGQPGGQGQQDPFAGFNPQDPALPILRQQQQLITSFQQRLQNEDHQRQQQQREGTFLQGLKGAREQFKSLTGIEPSEDQLRLVAGKMQQTGYLDGASLVPSLFVKEIQDAATAKILAERKTKRKLPKSGKSTRRVLGTQGRVSKRGAFEEEWDRHMDSED